MWSEAVWTPVMRTLPGRLSRAGWARTLCGVPGSSEAADAAKPVRRNALRPSMAASYSIRLSRRAGRGSQLPERLKVTAWRRRERSWRARLLEAQRARPLPGQFRHERFWRTSAACPLTRTLPYAAAMRPSGPMTNVDRRIPQYFLPKRDFSPHAP